MWREARRAAGRMLNGALRPLGFELSRYHPLGATALPRATLGEVSDGLRQVFGEHRELITV